MALSLLINETSSLTLGVFVHFHFYIKFHIYDIFYSTYKINPAFFQKSHLYVFSKFLKLVYITKLHMISLHMS